MDKCIVCNKGIRESSNVWMCENCGEPHHPRCSGDSQEGYGEYPHEEEYSYCKKCCKKDNGEKK